jgi:prophage regulatory protein
MADETKKEQATPRLLLFKELRPRGVLLSRRQVDRLEHEGKFPKRVHLSEQVRAWPAVEIDEWVSAKIAAR